VFVLEGKLTGINGIRPVTIVVLIQARNSTDVSFTIDNRIGQLLLFAIGSGKDGIVIKLIDHVDVCHFDAVL
jgi:hypothetical protein